MTKKNPELLLHPQIPRAMAGVNPRTIKGQSWWDAQRYKAYAKRDYHCWACGVHKGDAIIKQHLEAHEHFTVNPVEGRMKIIKIVALCFACHNFIHSGRLAAITAYLGTTAAHLQAFQVLEHGFTTLKGAGLGENLYAVDALHNLSLSWPGLGVLKKVPAWAKQELLKANVENILLALAARESHVAWEDWRMEFEGELYPPLYESHGAWKNAMDERNRETYTTDPAKIQKKVTSINNALQAGFDDLGAGDEIDETG